MTPKKAVIFDWDGTLIDSSPETYKGTCAVFDNCLVPEPSFADYRLNFRSPYTDFYYQRGLDISGAEIWRIYKSSVNLFNCKIFSDVFGTLTELNRRRVLIGLISGQAEEIVRFHSERNKLAAFFHKVVAGQESKVDALRAFCAENELDPSQVYFVGDFVSDMEDAKAAGVIPVGITRGFDPMRERLLRAGSHYCIDNLHELLLLLFG